MEGATTSTTSIDQIQQRLLHLLLHGPIEVRNLADIRVIMGEPLAPIVRQLARFRALDIVVSERRESRLTLRLSEQPSASIFACLVRSIREARDSSLFQRDIKRRNRLFPLAS